MTSRQIFSPPVVRDEWQVNEKKRHKKVRVFKAGEYKISIRSRDARGFSDEEVTTVQCRQRPKSLTNLRTKAPCPDKYSFRDRQGDQFLLTHLKKVNIWKYLNG